MLRSPMTVIACRDCAALQRVSRPRSGGRLDCWQCGRVLESRIGRSIPGALACSIAVLLLLLPANLMPLMTVHLGPVTSSSILASGLRVAWVQGWPLVTIVLALEAIVLPFARFGLLTVSLAMLRLGRRDRWIGTAFRYAETLDQWAMFDVLLIGAGIGYGRIASQVSVHIDAGGWCFVCASVMTMITRATLERADVWRQLGSEQVAVGARSIACTNCDLLLPAVAEGSTCPRCTAVVHRRRPFAVKQCTALLLATAVLTPLAYSLPMSEFWKGEEASPHSVINGIMLLFTSGFWYFGVIIFCVSLIFPLTKLGVLTWFVTSIHRRSNWQLRRKTQLYRFIDEVGRWSTLDPFTVMVFAPMIQFGQLAHFDFMGGSAVFLATVVLSMLATKAFDPRLLWDAARSGAAQPSGAISLSTSGSPRMPAT
ncbi:MAG TPA: paraquat-inducible protein A [Acetobacteraceae bacterium]|nr:paraquat-inducible protein A [Acetobacteraceae bacterium]